MPWEPMDFVKRASGLCHPGHFLDGVHEVLKELFHKMANCTTHCMARDRTAAMRKWSMRIAELKASKCSGIEGSPPHAKEILKNKNMKLFAEMVEASGSPDKTIAEDIAKGFDLMGPMPAGGVFLEKALHATLLPQQVRDMAPLAREATRSAVKKSRDNEMCQEIYDATADECAKGWLRGPFNFDQLPPNMQFSRGGLE